MTIQSKIMSGLTMSVSFLALSLGSARPAYAEEPVINAIEGTLDIFKDTVGGTIGQGVYEVLTGKPCVEGMRRVIVSENDVYNLQSMEVREVSVTCETEAQPSDEVLMADYRAIRDTKTKLIAFMYQARANKSVVTDVGLSAKDVALMSEYKLPTSRGIKNLSVALNLEPKDTKRVLKKMLEDAETANRTAYWESQGRVRHY